MVQRNQNISSLGVRVEVTAAECEGPFWGDGNILYLVWGVVVTGVYSCQNSLN